MRTASGDCGGAFLASGALCLPAAGMALRAGARTRELAGAPAAAGVAVAGD